MVAGDLSEGYVVIEAISCILLALSVTRHCRTETAPDLIYFKRVTVTIGLRLDDRQIMQIQFNWLRC